MNDRELMARLVEGAPRIGSQTLAEILARGEEFAPNLERILSNIRLWHTEEAGRVAVFHAVKLLGAMKYAPAAPVLIDAIFLACDTSNEDVLEELPIAFARIGPEAVPALRSILLDSSLDSVARSVAASGLEGVGVLHPEARHPILEVLKEILDQPGSSSQLRAHVVNILAHFRRPEDQANVARTLEEIPTALDVTRGDVEAYFESAVEPWQWDQYRIDPLEYYDDELA